MYNYIIDVKPKETIFTIFREGGGFMSFFDSYLEYSNLVGKYVTLYGDNVYYMKSAIVYWCWLKYQLIHKQNPN